MEIHSLNLDKPVEDQRAMRLLLHQPSRSVHMDYDGSLITAAAIEKSRFKFRLIQRLEIRIEAKQKLQAKMNKKLAEVDEAQIIEFIRKDARLLHEYQSTFAGICSDQPSKECFYSAGQTVPIKPANRPREIEHFLSNLVSLNKTASEYLHKFSHLFIHSNFSAYSFFNSVSEFVYYLSLYPSTNRSDLAWCPPESEGYSRCNSAIGSNWKNMHQSIEAGTLLTYHYNCLASYTEKVNEMKRHGVWIES